MKIIRKLLMSLALVCLLMGVILIGVSMVTGSGFDRVVAHGVLVPYLEMEMNFVTGIFNRAAESVMGLLSGFMSW